MAMPTVQVADVPETHWAILSGTARQAATVSLSWLMRLAFCRRKLSSVPSL